VSCPEPHIRYAHCSRHLNAPNSKRGSNGGLATKTAVNWGVQPQSPIVVHISTSSIFSGVQCLLGDLHLTSRAQLGLTLPALEVLQRLSEFQLATRRQVEQSELHHQASWLFTFRTQAHHSRACPKTWFIVLNRLRLALFTITLGL
jgi:hypothetical protein